MSRYGFELATQADDAKLRQVLAETPMEGDISVSFRREPSYFDAAVVSGDFCQTVIGRDSDNKRIVGCGVRAVREMFVNGEPMPIGYLSSLRVLPAYRSLGLIARGYAYFRQLHADGHTPLYLTTIAEGNDPAVSLLTSRRAGLPPYHYAGRYFSLLLPAKCASRNDRNGDLNITRVRSARSGDMPNVLAFLETNGRQRQFFPKYKSNDFLHPRGTFRDLKTDDLFLAICDGRIVGTLGVWDQRGFRQSVVERYSARWQWMRPLYNGWALLRGRPSLPPVGRPFEYVVGALPVVADDDAAIFEALLDAAQSRAAMATAEHLLIGLHEDDPLLPRLRSHAVASYATLLYYVCWEDGETLRQALDGRVPYLELGTL